MKVIQCTGKPSNLVTFMHSSMHGLEQGFYDGLCTLEGRGFASLAPITDAIIHKQRGLESNADTPWVSVLESLGRSEESTVASLGSAPKVEGREQTRKTCHHGVHQVHGKDRTLH